MKALCTYKRKRIRIRINVGRKLDNVTGEITNAPMHLVSNVQVRLIKPIKQNSEYIIVVRIIVIVLRIRNLCRRTIRSLKRISSLEISDRGGSDRMYTDVRVASFVIGTVMLSALP